MFTTNSFAWYRHLDSVKREGRRAKNTSLNRLRIHSRPVTDEDHWGQNRDIHLTFAGREFLSDAPFFGLGSHYFHVVSCSLSHDPRGDGAARCRVKAAVRHTSLVPRLRPAFRRLQYGIATESWAGPENEVRHTASPHKVFVTFKRKKKRRNKTHSPTMALTLTLTCILSPNH